MVSDPVAGRQARWWPVTLMVTATTALGVTGCSDQASPGKEPDQGAVNPTVVVSPSQTSVTSSPDVRVRASLGVPRTAAVAAVLAFVRAHAESVNAGRVTPRLAAVSTPAELARQRRVVAFAVEQGYVVPRMPVLRVMSLLDESATEVRLGVCFWLPSTEYVDARTRDSASGPVPKAWAPAVTTVRLAHLTWSVDTVSEPDNETTIDCGSQP
jgi:hypothetical protein